MNENPWWVEEVGDSPPADPIMGKTEAKGQLFWVLRYYGANIRPSHVTNSLLGEGSWVPCHCPFHDDQHASASVNFRVHKFKCHSCDAHGDAIDLVMREECLSFKDALIWITEHFSQVKDYGLLRTPPTSTGSGAEA